MPVEIVEAVDTSDVEGFVVAFDEPDVVDRDVTPVLDVKRELGELETDKLSDTDVVEEDEGPLVVVKALEVLIVAVEFALVLLKEVVAVEFALVLLKEVIAVELLTNWEVEGAEDDNELIELLELDDGVETEELELPLPDEMLVKGEVVTDELAEPDREDVELKEL